MHTRVADPDPYSESGSRRTKMTHKSRNFFEKFMFWSVGWPLLRAEDFFCNLDVLYGGLGIGKLQFLIKKKLNFFFQLLFLFNFWSLKPWIRIGSGSVSGSVLASIRILWIRIRIRNLNTDPDPGGQKWPTKVEKIHVLKCWMASFVSWRLLL